MSTINDRINAVVDFSGLSKTKFGKEINLTQSMVSKLCSGAATPSDRTIADICRVFDINESWLLTGEGEMIDYVSRELEIAKIFSNTTLISPEFTEDFIKALARIPDNKLPELARYATALAKEHAAADNAKAPDATNAQD